MGNTEKRHYSDSELIQMLEENGYEVSYSQVEKLRAGIESGEILVGDYLTEDNEMELVDYLSTLSEEEYKKNSSLYNSLLEQLKKGEPILLESVESLSEGLNDYELLGLLENNGYETSTENLVQLKEGLADGSIEIIDQYPEYLLECLLENSGYDISEDNLAILAEGLDSGLYELDEETLNEAFFQNLGTRIKTAGKNIKDTVRTKVGNLKRTINVKTETHRLNKANKAEMKAALLRAGGKKASAEDKDRIQKEYEQKTAETKQAQDQKTAKVAADNKRRNGFLTGRIRKNNQAAANEISARNAEEASEKAGKKIAKLEKKGIHVDGDVTVDTKDVTVGFGKNKKTTQGQPVKVEKPGNNQANPPKQSAPNVAAQAVAKQPAQPQQPAVQNKQPAPAAQNVPAQNPPAQPAAGAQQPAGAKHPGWPTPEEQAAAAKKIAQMKKPQNPVKPNTPPAQPAAPINNGNSSAQQPAVQNKQPAPAAPKAPAVGAGALAGKSIINRVDNTGATINANTNAGNANGGNAYANGGRASSGGIAAGGNSANGGTAMGGNGGTGGNNNRGANFGISLGESKESMANTVIDKGADISAKSNLGNANGGTAKADKGGTAIGGNGGIGGLTEMTIPGIVSFYINSSEPYTHKAIVNTCMKYCLSESDESSISGISVFMEKVEKEIAQQEAAQSAAVDTTGDGQADSVAVDMNGNGQADAAINKSITVTPNGDLQVATVDKQVTLTSDGTLNVSLAESKQRVSRTNYILESYLVDDCGFTTAEFKALTEEVKTESIKEIAIEVLKAVEEKLQSADTSCADRSRGDIKKLVELPSIQDAITKLEALIERDENSIPAYTQYIGTIIKSILYINQYSAVFKDAYRNKKTLMMLKYESLILAIVSSISYALSTIVEYKANQISLKEIPNSDLLNFAPYKTLEAFNRSVDSGEFKVVAGDITVLREFFLEVPVEQMSLVLEASDFMPLIVNGVRGVLSALDDNSGKISSYLYKAVGIIILIFSLRDVIYAVTKMKTKVPDMLAAIANFANLNNGGGLISKLASFATKFSSDAETGSDLSQREIEDENRRMATKVRKVQASSVISSPAADPVVKAAVDKGAEETSDDVFGFDF